MQKNIKKIVYGEHECFIWFREDTEIDRAAKFERYPLLQLEKSLSSPEWKDKKINYYEIGANVGISVLFAAKMIGNSGSVQAFEVEPTNYARLIENVTLNEFTNTIGFPFGISKECGLRPFFINQRHLIDGKKPRTGEGLHSFYTYDEMEGWHSKKNSFQACVLSLDRVVELFELPEPTHVFIDAFGSEYEIIKGMQNLMDNGHLDIIMVQIEEVKKYCEGEACDIKLNKTYKHLISRGYELVESQALPGIEDFLRGYNCIFRRR